MVSLWEKQSFLTCDVLIIGAGITGLSAAASLKEQDPKLRVSVLERGILPTGASTKNAGFACFGSVSELKSDIETLGADGMVSLVEKRIKGLRKTQDRLGEKNIDLQVKGGYELLFDDGALLDEMDAINDLLFPLFKKSVYQSSDEKIPIFGFKSTNHLIENPLEGQLDTGKLISSLWQYCAELGVRIHTGCEVTQIDDGNQISVHTKDLTFRAEKLVICTNAFSKTILSDELDLNPGRGMVMSIRPQQPLKINGTFHYKEGYYYFRDYYGRLLFGGGRDLDIDGETTTDFGVNEKIRQQLIHDLEQMILPDCKYEIEDTWSGIMAFGKNKSPIVKKVSENIAVGVRLGGMGIAIGSLVGQEVADLLRS